MKKGWKLKEWTGISPNPVPMTDKEIRNATKYLKENNYPTPEDCEGDICPGFRPSCKVGICYVAVRLCGDF